QPERQCNNASPEHHSSIARNRDVRLRHAPAVLDATMPIQPSVGMPTFYCFNDGVSADRNPRGLWLRAPQRSPPVGRLDDETAARPDYDNHPGSTPCRRAGCDLDRELRTIRRYGAANFMKRMCVVLDIVLSPNTV